MKNINVDNLETKQADARKNMHIWDNTSKQLKELQKKFNDIDVFFNKI